MQYTVLLAWKTGRLKVAGSGTGRQKSEIVTWTPGLFCCPEKKNCTDQRHWDCA